MSSESVNQTSDNPKLIVIVGETATGKSSLAHQIALKYNGAIICADSWTVYRGFDIGTAKPSKSERREVPYYLLDIRDADAGFSAAEFQHLANDAIKEIVLAGKLPIMVGGTGLYIDSVLFNYSFSPSGSEAERKRLQLLSIADLIAEITQRKLDLSGIDLRNKRRLIRLLETNGDIPTRNENIKEGSLMIGLKPASRAELRCQIENRVENMFKQGLKREVESLLKSYSWETEAMKGIGYREWQDYFTGNQSQQAIKRKIIKSTLDLAKRQRSWFKRNRQILWFDDSAAAISRVDKFLSRTAKIDHPRSEVVN